LLGVTLLAYRRDAGGLGHRRVSEMPKAGSGDGTMAETELSSMDVVRIEDRGAVRILRMNRPAKLNALNTDLLVALHAALKDADQDDAVRALVLTGEGRGFSAGADLGEFRGEKTPESVKRNMLRSELMGAIQVLLRKLQKPVVAAVHGAAIGGGAAFAVCCDMVVAGSNLKFGYPELNHHLTPTGVMTSLVKQAGAKIAFEMISLGANFGAEDALRIGLVNRVVPVESVLETALQIANTWAELDPVQMAATKNMFYRMGEQSFEDGLALGRDISISMRHLAAAKAKE
jgi:enoyl-CoA hydratase